MLDHIYDNFGSVLTLTADGFSRDRMEMYAKAIREKPLQCGYEVPLHRCFGFIDGTVRPISRPTNYKEQEEVYNGWKRQHALKYQIITTPDGLIADCFGPMVGRRHDLALLKECRLLDRLSSLPKDLNNQSYYIYGDAAYHSNEFMQAPFKGCNLSEDMERYNRAMSEVRLTVEYGFQRVVTLWAFVDFKKNQKLKLSKIGKQYLVAIMLANLHCCMYGNQTCQYFDIQPPTAEEYLAQAGPPVILPSSISSEEEVTFVNESEE